jgi:hypothetical protein
MKKKKNLQANNSIFHYQYNIIKMSTRRCSCCLQTGHNIKSCKDETAELIMNEIMNTNADTAISLVNTITNNHVLFVLVRGFNLTVRSNRNALRECVVNLYTSRVVLSTPHVYNHRELYNQYNAVVENYYIENPMMIRQMHIHKLLVRNYLTRVEAGAREQNTFSFNTFIERVLNPSRNVYRSQLERILRSSEIMQIDNMIMMYNEYRLIENSETFEDIIRSLYPQRHEEPMKTLVIDVAICERCEDDTCGVCFEELKSEKVVKTGCGHVYCSTCIGGIAKQRGMKSFIPCPGCRAEIKELKVQNEEEKKIVLTTFEKGCAKNILTKI